jgi:hypothetical protein
VARPIRWINDLPKIIERVEAAETRDFLREDVESLFTVGKDRALQIIRNFGGECRGGRWSISKRSLLLGLQASRGELADTGEARRCRVAAVIAEGREELTARSVLLPVVPAECPRTLDALPASVVLEKGRLTIKFGSAEDLLVRLFELSQVLQRDYLEVQRFLDC